MSRLFISHSSANNADAIAILNWLREEGWDDVFLDLDPVHGIAAGERWERALNEAAKRCEAVIFLLIRAWLASKWCERELNLARRLNNRLFGVLIEDLQKSIRRYIKEHNKDAKPFVWTKPADVILAKLQRLPIVSYSHGEDHLAGASGYGSCWC